MQEWYPAAQVYERAIGDEIDNAWSHINLASCYLALHRWDDACLAMRRISRLRPGDRFLQRRYREVLKQAYEASLAEATWLASNRYYPQALKAVRKACDLLSASLPPLVENKASRESRHRYYRGRPRAAPVQAVSRRSEGRAAGGRRDCLQGDQPAHGPRKSLTRVRLDRCSHLLSRRCLARCDVEPRDPAQCQDTCLLRNRRSGVRCKLVSGHLRELWRPDHARSLRLSCSWRRGFRHLAESLRLRHCRHTGARQRNGGARRQRPGLRPSQWPGRRPRTQLSKCSRSWRRRSTHLQRTGTKAHNDDFELHRPTRWRGCCVNGATRSSLLWWAT